MSENLRMVSSMSALQALKASEVRKPDIGEIVYVQDEDKLYIATESGYQLYAPAAVNESGLNMSLYDLNKAVIQQLPELTPEQIEVAVENIDAWRANITDNFFMLYGKEISYFTVFMDSDIKINNETLGMAVIDCLDYLGSVRSIELTEDKTAFEIWINQDDMSTCLYLFPYENAIVRIGG